MIINDNFRKKIPNEFYLRSLSGSSGVFLDIETTGLRKENSQIYLIGLSFPTGSSEAPFKEVEIFAESPSEERDMLLEFNRIMGGFPGGSVRFITFNGRSFDLPFILFRCEKYAIPPLNSLNDGSDIDLYRLIRPYKSLFSLNRLKQKDIERFLYIDREDKYSGGELINVY